MTRPTKGTAWFRAQGQSEAAHGYPIMYMRESRQWLPLWAREARGGAFWSQSASKFNVYSVGKTGDAK